MITRRSVLSLFFPPIFFPVLFKPERTGVEPIAPPVQWEYLIAVCDPGQRGALPEILGKRGLEGWQLCTRTDTAPNLTELIFKRPIQTH